MLINLIVTIALIITFGLLDYFLTIYLIGLYKKKMFNYIEYEHLELNPVSREKIEIGKYDIRHLTALIVISTVLLFFYLVEINIFSFFQGLFLSHFGYLVSRHIQALIKLMKFNKNPKILTGKLIESYIYCLNRLVGEVVAISFLLFLVFIFSPSFFTIGFALGPSLMLLKIKGWKKAYLVKT